MTKKELRQLHDMLNEYSLEHVLEHVAKYLDTGSYVQQIKARELRNFIDPSSDNLDTL